MVGSEADVDDLLEVSKNGPPLARTDKIDTKPATGVVPRGFETRPTA